MPCTFIGRLTASLPLTLAFGLVAFGPVRLASAAAPPPDKLLPASTLAVLSVPDYVKFNAASTNDPVWRFLQDPAMKPMVDKLSAKWKSDVVVKLEQQFGIKFADYAELAQGQMTLAFMSQAADAKDGSLQPFVFIMDSDSKAELLKKSLADLRKKWVDAGKKLKTETIRGVEFTALMFTPAELDKALQDVFPKPQGQDQEEDKDLAKEKQEDKEADEKESGKTAVAGYEWYVGQSESLLLLGNIPAHLEKVLSLQAGASSSTLAEVPSFASHRGALFGDSSLYVWANLQEVVGMVRKALEPDAGARRRNVDSGPSSAQILDGSGLAGLRSLAFSLRPSAEGSLHDLRIEVPESERVGLLKILGFEAKDASPPPFVPQDVLSFSRTRIDWLKGFETLEATVVKLFPQSASFIKLIMETTGKEKDPNFDLRKNLIGNLGDDYISYSKAPAEKTLAGLASGPSIHLIGARNADQLMAALKTLTAFMPAQAGKREREFLGRQVFSLNVSGSKQSLSFVSSGGYLVIANEDGILEEYLRSSEQKSKPLSAAPGLTEDAQKVRGTSTGSFGYANLKESARLQFEVFKKESGTLANLLAGAPLASRLGLDEDSSALKSWVDFSLLPPFDKVAQYFHHSVYTWAFTPAGIELRSFTPVPPELKK
ncbi:MAG: hypothetical protein JNN07_14670 [Verrucomicrobiales bacterium]|nr:hypothetical protein [Verrucomicrobiales bacterium]